MNKAQFQPTTDETDLSMQTRISKLYHDLYLHHHSSFTLTPSLPPSFPPFTGALVLPSLAPVPDGLPHQSSNSQNHILCVSHQCSVSIHEENCMRYALQPFCNNNNRKKNLSNYFIIPLGSSAQSEGAKQEVANLAHA